MDWDNFLARNREHLYPYEILFIERVLPKVDVKPRCVEAQRSVVDSAGVKRRIDFAIHESELVKIAIECDGWDKAGRGMGPNRREWRDEKERQNELAAQGWRVLRFPNSEIEEHPERCATTINDTLRELRDLDLTRMGAVPVPDHVVAAFTRAAEAAERAAQASARAAFASFEPAKATHSPDSPRGDPRQSETKPPASNANYSARGTATAAAVIIGSALISIALFVRSGAFSGPAKRQQPVATSVDAAHTPIRAAELTTTQERRSFDSPTPDSKREERPRIYSPEQARNLVGQFASVCGTVTDANWRYVKGQAQPTFLNFGGRYPNHVFTVVMENKERQQFRLLEKGDPEYYFRGRNVCVSGLVSAFQGKPRIILRDLSQLSEQH